MALLLHRVKRHGMANAKKQSRGKHLAPGRMGKDLESLDGTDKDKFVLEFPDPNNILQFSCTFHVDAENSMWYGGVYKFNIDIPDEYPIKPPKVELDPEYRVWHPNIDTNGAVCLNIIKKDWKPVCAINQVFFGLYFLFYEPNTDDPLNLQAADEMRSDRQTFSHTVKKTLRGEKHKNIKYPNMADHLRNFKRKKNQLKSDLENMVQTHATPSGTATN